MYAACKASAPNAAREQLPTLTLIPMSLQARGMPLEGLQGQPSPPQEKLFPAGLPLPSYGLQDTTPDPCTGWDFAS